jgi:hypothetical protein
MSNIRRDEVKNSRRETKGGIAREVLHQNHSLTKVCPRTWD